MAVEVFARHRSRLLSGRAVVVQLRHGIEQADGVGKLPGVAGVALRQRFALPAVAVQQGRRGLALEHGGQLPAQVHRVFHRSVVAQAARGGEQVRGVAADEHAPLLKARGHQRVTGQPGRHRQDLDGDVQPAGPREQGPRIGVRQRIDIGVVGELRVEGELADPVHRHDEGALRRVHLHVHPGAVVGVQAVEVGRLQVHGQHAPAHEAALEAAAAFPFDAQPGPHAAACAVSAHQPAGLHGRAGLVGGMRRRHFGRDALARV